MKKLICLLCILILASCSSFKKTKVDNYSKVYENFSKLSSFEINMNINDVIKNEDSEDDINSMKGSFVYDLKNSKYSSSLTILPSNYKTEEWFDNGVLYISNDDFKFTYTDVLDNKFNELVSYFHFNILNLDISDVDKLSYKNEDKKEVYKFTLSTLGINKLLDATNYFGYKDIFQFQKGSIDYVVYVLDNQLNEIKISGLLNGDINGRKTEISIDEEYIYTNFDSSEIKFPDNLDEFKKEGLESEVNDKQSFINYLKNTGYKEENPNLYYLQASDIMKYYYNFLEQYHSVSKDNIEYKYYYNLDVGEVEACKYSISKNETIDNSVCSEEQIIDLLVAKETFNYDINDAGITNLTVLDN